MAVMRLKGGAGVPLVWLLLCCLLHQSSAIPSLRSGASGTGGQRLPGGALVDETLSQLTSRIAQGELADSTDADNIDTLTKLLTPLTGGRAAASFLSTNEQQQQQQKPHSPSPSSRTNSLTAALLRSIRSPSPAARSNSDPLLSLLEQDETIQKDQQQQQQQQKKKQQTTTQQQQQQQNQQQQKDSVHASLPTAHVLHLVHPNLARPVAVQHTVIGAGVIKTSADDLTVTDEAWSRMKVPSVEEIAEAYPAATPYYALTRVRVGEEQLAKRLQARHALTASPRDMGGQQCPLGTCLLGKMVCCSSAFCCPFGTRCVARTGGTFCESYLPNADVTLHPALALVKWDITIEVAPVTPVAAAAPPQQVETVEVVPSPAPFRPSMI